MSRSFEDASHHDLGAGELDLRGIGGVLNRHRKTIAAVCLTAFALSFAFVHLVSPRYQAESLILLENQENLFTLPDRTGQSANAALPADPEAVGSQIQLITSRDLAATAIKDLGLRDSPEFASSSFGLMARLFGGSNDSADDSAETHAVKVFEDKLSVFSPPKTRVITIQFSSKSPELAAKVANEMADLYIAEQTNAKQDSAKLAADALNAQIVDLRGKLARADDEREKYRAESGLLTGANSLTITGQQLADINSELSRARTSQAEAQAKASMIRDLLRAGKTADVPDVINNDLVRHVAEERVAAQANLALESRTLLPSHPRIQALNAQVAGLDEALKAAAKQAVATLENDAKIAGQRLRNLEALLAEQKKAAGTSNSDEVHLRALDRVAQTYKDQLESSMAKYQEAIARQTSNATPADARIIARATEPQEPIFPKKLPIITFATVAAFLLTAGVSVAGELLSASSPPAGVPVAPRPLHQTEPPLVERAARGRQAPAEDASESVFVPGAAVSQRREPIDQDSVPERTEPPRSALQRLGAGLRAFGESAFDTRMRMASRDRPAHPVLDENEEPEMTPRQVAQPAFEAAGPSGENETQQDLVDRIVADHVPGRGVQIAGASIGMDALAPAPADEIIGLARALAERGRAIIVDLNASPVELEPLVNPGQGQPAAQLTGLSELLAGEVSFAEVIHRDHATRLHFIPAGTREADFRDFDLILEALSETYDFIVLLSPSFPASEIVKIMAPHTDFIVLTAVQDIGERQLALLESELVEAGAKEILVARHAMPGQRTRRAPDVA